MRMASKTLAYHPQAAKFTPLITDITTCLLNLNPQSPNPSRINKSLLNQFSSQLHPELVIQVIKKQSNPYHALFFFNWASNPSPNPKNYVHSHHCYVAITDHLLSHSIFDAASSLLENANRFSDLMASKFIIAYGNHRNVDKAMDWFCKAKTFGNGNVLFSYNAILNVLVDGGRISLAQSIFDEMVRSVSVKPDVSSYCVMIKGYCRIGKFENAWKVFDEMSEPNLVCYNTMINGYCKKGDMKKAKEVLYRSENNENFRPPCLDNGRPINVWPPPVSPYQCSFCQVLREIIHINGNCSTKLEIHGRVGIICHAVLEDKVNVGSSGPRLQMIDFCKKSIDNVKQFLIQYCENLKNAGFVMVQDPLSIFYEALCVGLDEWDDDPIDDIDFNGPSPPTFPAGAPQDYEMEEGNEAERATTITPKITLAQQRKRTGKLKLKDFASYFHLPMEESAKRMSLCPTVVKKICRKYGLKRWPHRKIKSCERKISILMPMTYSNNEGVKERALEEIRKLQQEISDYLNV